MQSGAINGGELARLARSAADAKQAANGDNSLRETARQFEALFVKQLLSQVDISAGIGGGENAQSDFVNSMWRDKISQQMTQGEGLGLAKMLVSQLGGSAPSVRASTGGGVQPLVDLQAKAQQLYETYGKDAARFDSREQFVEELKPHLEKAAQELGISPKVLLAQAALETGWGQRLPQDAQGNVSRNLFGIKADRGWTGDAVNSPTAEFLGGRFEELEAGFRSYSSFADSVRDYVDFLKSNPRYQQALQHGGSDENFLQGLKSAGYATDPQYVEKIIDVANGPSMERYWNEI